MGSLRGSRLGLILSVLGLSAAARAAGTLEELKSAGWDRSVPQIETLRARLQGARGAATPDGGGDVQPRHESNPAVHQWIVVQARSIWSVPELEARLPAAWSDAVADLDRAPLTCGARMEDAETDMSRFALCGGHPYCEHFWDPAKGDAAGLFFLRRWDSAYVRAQKLWDGRVLPLYRAGRKDEAYYWLGRVAHLLADVSVPAHAHRDFHPFWESYERYLVELEDGAYNFKRWTGSGAPAAADSLRELFLSMAGLAAGFDSARAAGTLPGNSVGHNGAWEKQGRISRHYNVSYAECRRQADVLMPAAFQHMAGLYRLFWTRTHPSQPTPGVRSGS